MQPQYSQGAAPSHHPPPYAPPEVSQTNGGSITSSLRQWRKKDYVEKQPSTEPPPTAVSENPSHVARVAPHTYYPRPANDLCHYQHQYAEYSVPYKPPAPAPVKYSEIVENQQAQSIEHITPMIPKHKDKEYVDLCSVPPQPHMKQYPDHLSLKQPYPESIKQTYSDPTVHHQYISKESQIHSFLQKQPQMHQYMQKEPYQQFLPKYNMQGQYPQSYPSEPNNFLAHLNKINPRMAQSIMNDAHLRDSQIPMYHNLDQNRSYSQPQRMYQAPAMHSSPTHTHRNITQAYNYSQPYNYNVKSNMQQSDPYRVQQYHHSVPKYLPDYKMNEQPMPNISPQRMYNETVHMNYAPMPPKISPNYPHCGQLEYAQHYQHRRQIPQEYYSHPAYKSTYVQNPQVSPEESGADARTQKSSLKQYLESWVEEDLSGNLPDIIVSNNLSDVENMESLKDTTEIPNETLPHFLHLQQFEKLPDNIRGYYHSASAITAGGRRIIIENSSESSPESNQIVKGNSVPVVSKVTEIFTEGANAVAVEGDRIIHKTDENRRKITSGCNHEGMKQNLENKVVQLHIVEETEATAKCDNANSATASILNVEPKNLVTSSETVIIQTNTFQHSPVNAKTVETDDNCVIKKHIPEAEEESLESKVVNETNESCVKSMPEIDSNIREAAENEALDESSTSEDTSSNSSTEEDSAEICEDLQSEDLESEEDLRSEECDYVQNEDRDDLQSGEDRRSEEREYLRSDEREHLRSEEREYLRSDEREHLRSEEREDLRSEEPEELRSEEPEDLHNEGSRDLHNAEDGSLPNAECGDLPNAQLGDLPKEEHGDLKKEERGDLPNAERGGRPNAEPGDLPKEERGDLKKEGSGDLPKERGDLQKEERGVLPKEERRDIQNEERGDRQNSEHGDLQKEELGDIQNEERGDIQNEERGDLQNAERSDLQKEERGDIQNEELSDIQNEERGDLQNEEREDLQTEEREDLQNEEREDLQNEERESLQNEQRGVLQNEERGVLQNEERGDLQSEEQLNSSLCSIYKEMEHIHGENGSVTPVDNGKDPECAIDPHKPKSPVHLQQEEEVENLSYDKIKTVQAPCSLTEEQTSTEEPNTKDAVVPTAISPSLITNTEKEQVEKSNSPTIEVQECSIDLTRLAIREVPCALEDVTIAENYKATTHVKDHVVSENENHRNVSKKLRTAKGATCVAEEQTSKRKSVVEEQTKEVDLSFNDVTEDVRKNIIEPDSNSIVANKSRDNRKKVAAERKYKRRHSADNKMKTILKIPDAKEKIRRNSAINCQSSYKNLLPNKETFTNQFLKCSFESSEKAAIGTKAVEKSLSDLSIKNHLIYTNEENMPKIVNQDVSVKNAETTDRVIATLAKNNETFVDVPKLETENVANAGEKLEDLSSIVNEVTANAHVKIHTQTSSERKGPKKIKKCVRFADSVAVECNTTGVNSKDYIESTKPLNLSVQKKCSESDALQSTEDCKETPMVTDDQTEDVVESINTVLSPKSDDIVIPEIGITSENITRQMEVPQLSPATSVEPFEFVECTNDQKEPESEPAKIEDALNVDNNFDVENVRLKTKKKTKTKNIPVKIDSPKFKKKSAKTFCRIRNKDKILQQESATVTDVPRKSRRLNKHLCEENECQPASIPALAKETSTALHANDLVLDKQPDTDCTIQEVEIPQEANSLEDVQVKPLEGTENVNSKTVETGNCEMVNDKPTENDQEGSYVDDKEMPALEAEPPLINTSNSEIYEDSEASVVYQINDTNVVLQIADELLQINITAHNGRRVILVKTFSDAIIMNSSEETECPVLEDESAVQLEDKKTETQDQKAAEAQDQGTTEVEDQKAAEVPDQKTCEDQAVLNNNYIDLTKTDEGHGASEFCLKEICDGSEITTVETDVCIYNEEVVSSSTEVETTLQVAHSKTGIIDDKKAPQRKYATRKSSKKDKVAPCTDEKCCLTKSKCLADNSKVAQKKTDSISKESFMQKPSTIKDSLRKIPKTKAALKFVESVLKPPKPKAKDQKVPLKAVDSVKEDAKKVARSKKRPHASEQSAAKSEATEINAKSKEKHHSQDRASKANSNNHHKNESHGNRNKVAEATKTNETKTKEKAIEVSKAKEKTNVSEKTKNSSSRNTNTSPAKEDRKMRKPPKLPQNVPKDKPKIDLLYRASIEPSIIPTSKSDSIKKQKQKSLAGETDSAKSKKSDVKIKEVVVNLSKDITEGKSGKAKSEELPKNHAIKQKIEEKADPAVEDQPEEKLVSVQENSITSSTSQDHEAVIRERSSKLIQQIADDWEDDSDDVKMSDNSCKRRLSLQEYNDRKRSNSLVELETDLTSNLLNDVNLSGSKAKRETSPDSPMLSVKFNNKTYSRSCNTHPAKDNVSPLNYQSKDTNADYKKEEPLSSAIELQLPKINRSPPKPIYNQEYLRNALMNDLHTVTALTATLIKENQQLMQRFLEQQRLTAEELKKVKQIIRYKRLVQHLTTLKISEIHGPNLREHLMMRTDPDSNHISNLKLASSLSCDVNKGQSRLAHIVDAKELMAANRPHLEEGMPFKKVNPDRRKRKRFRFLYSDEETESNDSPVFSSAALANDEAQLDTDLCLKRPRLDNSVPALDPKVMDYSVHQSNSQGQLTLVFKRSFKSDPRMQPFVKLERLSSIDELARNKLH